MSLLVPLEMRRAINVHSGYITLASKFGKKNLKGLFFTNENKVYLTKELFSLITNDSYVLDIAESLQVNPIGPKEHARTVMSSVSGQNFKPYFQDLNDRILVLMEAYPLPYREDILVSNPIQQLSNVNKEFLLTTSKTIIAAPDSLIKDYYDISPISGVVDAPEWDFGAASYSDGTWHPEHLFTQSKRNRSNPYWVPRNVTFDTNPPSGDDAPAYGDRSTAFHPRAQHYDITERASKRTQQPIELFSAAPSTSAKKQTKVNTKQTEVDTKLQQLKLLAGQQRSEIMPSFVVDAESVDIPNLVDLLTEPTYPVHGSNSSTYHTESAQYGAGPGPGNRYRYDQYGRGGFSGGGTFPRWQYSMNDRPFQRDIREGLREGGSSDRRVQQPHGYDMSALLTKSTV